MARDATALIVEDGQPFNHINHYVGMHVRVTAGGLSVRVEVKRMKEGILVAAYQNIDFSADLAKDICDFAEAFIRKHMPPAKDWHRPIKGT